MRVSLFIFSAARLILILNRPCLMSMFEPPLAIDPRKITIKYYLFCLTPVVVCSYCNRASLSNCNLYYPRLISFYLFCSFLDKVYLMATPEAFAKFLKNPRPYLLPPQPRPPAKFAVFGPPQSGTTTLSTLLAERYALRYYINFFII